MHAARRAARRRRPGGARERAAGAADRAGRARRRVPATIHRCRRRRTASGPPIWVVAEMGPSGPRAITAELLAKAAHLAAPLGSRVEAIVIGPGEAHAAALAAAGADRVLVADAPGLDPYTTEAHASVLADAIRRRAPRLVLLGSTVRGRDLAPRVAARLGLGLTGDAIDLDVDAEGRVRQLKPAFGGTIVAPILSRTRPEMATVRPGMLHPARPDPSRDAIVERLVVTRGDEPGAGRRPPGARRRRGGGAGDGHARPRRGQGHRRPHGAAGDRAARHPARRRRRRHARGDRRRLAAAPASGGPHGPRDRAAPVRRARGQRRHGAHGRPAPRRHHRRDQQEPEGADPEAPPTSGSSPTSTTCCRTSRRRCGRDAAGSPRRPGDRRRGDRLRHRARSWRGRDASVAARRTAARSAARRRAPRRACCRPRAETDDGARLALRRASLDALPGAGGSAPRRDRRRRRARPRRRAGARASTRRPRRRSARRSRAVSPQGLRAAWLDARALRAAEPAVDPRGPRRRALSRTTGAWRATALIEALAASARRRGAHLLPGAEVRSVERRGDRIDRVRVGDAALSPGAVVLAAGAWSRAHRRASRRRLP